MLSKTHDPLTHDSGCHLSDMCGPCVIFHGTADRICCAREFYITVSDGDVPRSQQRIYNEDLLYTSGDMSDLSNASRRQHRLCIALFRIEAVCRGHGAQKQLSKGENQGKGLETVRRPGGLSVNSEMVFMRIDTTREGIATQNHEYPGIERCRSQPLVFVVPYGALYRHGPANQSTLMGNSVRGV